MTLPTAELTITEVAVPASLDDADAADFVAAVALNNAVCLADSGVDDYERTPAEMLPMWKDRTDHVHHTFIARAGDSIIGAISLYCGVAEPTSAEVDLMVLPEHWPTGVGQALLDRAEEEVRLQGRRVLQAWTLHPAVPGSETLTPKTGWGVISSSPHTRLLEHNGFTLEQVERSSGFDLQADPYEKTNLAESATHQQMVKDFRAEAARRWDVKALHEQVLASQRRRHLVYQALSQGKHTSWDFQPLRDASTSYMRNHLVLDDLEYRSRLPHVGEPPIAAE